MTAMKLLTRNLVSNSKFS